MLDALIRDKSPIHTRDIRLSTFPHEQDTVLVHGELTDRRHVPIIDILGRPKDPGIIHRISVILLIAPDPLRILDAEAKMSVVPTDQCPETLDRVPLLKGLEIRPGYSRRIRQIMGSTLGCTHLCTLIKAMGQEIVHGWLTQKRTQAPSLSPVNNLEADTYLVNSCRLWKKDGPRNRAMRKDLETRRP